MVRNCWNTASGQMGWRLVESCGLGVETSATAMRLAKSVALVGAGKSQETSLAESGALAGIWAAARPGFSAGCLDLHAAVAMRIPSKASVSRRREEEVRARSMQPS